LKQSWLILIALTLVLAGCSINENSKNVEKTITPVDTKVEKKATQKSERTITVDEEITKRFSYLEQLPAEKQEAFIQFKVEKDLRNLNNFTPEEMLLVYLYCISIGDPDLIYLITYNAGQLPDPDTFRKDYFEYVMNYDLETAIHYRYYDSIKVEESTVEENKLIVLISVGIESTTNSLGLSLQKEDQVWKIDIYHLMKEYKNKAVQE
jgi:hypothetical protein